MRYSPQTKKITIKAFQIADNLDLLACKKAFNLELLSADKDELFFKYDEGYLYLLRYGVICTANITTEKVSKIKRELFAFCKAPQVSDLLLTETVNVNINCDYFKIDFDNVALTDDDIEKIKLIMLNASQSVALDYYADITEKLLEDTQKHTSFLEVQGKLDIGGKTLKKYIGKVLNVKNKISENLYIFDSPEVAWEDEALNKLNQALKNKFDLKDRYQTINQQLNIIKENLELFKEIMFHRESSKLEWIIIILILVEVIDLLILKLFK